MINTVLVDKNDKVLGLKEKFTTHKIPVPLHRAISIVIFNEDKSQMLITKRAKSKVTWPGFWTNAVCTHPYPNETYQDAAERRLYEELGIKTQLRRIFRFIYSAEMDNGVWGENELDHVFVGRFDGDIKPNKKEISDYKWVDVRDLGSDVVKSPHKYTPWFAIILNKLFKRKKPHRLNNTPKKFGGK